MRATYQKTVDAKLVAIVTSDRVFKVKIGRRKGHFYFDTHGHQVTMANRPRWAVVDNGLKLDPKELFEEAAPFLVGRCCICLQFATEGSQFCDFCHAKGFDLEAA